MNTQSACARFDEALKWVKKKHVPKDRPAPKPSVAWPKENIALLEHFQQWLFSSGMSVNVVHQIYVPAAGYALGLLLKPHTEWDLDADFQRVHEYFIARRLGRVWAKNNHNALEKFRVFLRQQRGQYEVEFRPVDLARYCQGLPEWLVKQLERYQHLRQAYWRPARLNERAMNFWGTHSRVWRWLFEHYPFDDVADIKRQYLLDYIDGLLTQGYSARTINGFLRSFRAFLFFLQDQGYRVPQALLRIPPLKEPECLPRFLTDEQVRRLRDDLEQRAHKVQSAAQRRDALLDRATFYLMWQGGLRLSEVEELHMDDVDLAGRKLMVRQGKGLKDRAVYLTDSAVRALAEYLTVRGMGPTEQVFFYRNKPLQKDLIRSRIKDSGKRTGVAVTPHRLRHTCATQLLNAGCRVTSIQKLMGHRQLSATMVYAKAYDQNVSADYYAAMARIETRLELDKGIEVDERLFIHPFVRVALLALANRLADSQLKHKARLELIDQMRSILDGKVLENVETATV